MKQFFIYGLTEGEALIGTVTWRTADDMLRGFKKKKFRDFYITKDSVVCIDWSKVTAMYIEDTSEDKTNQIGFVGEKT